MKKPNKTWTLEQLGVFAEERVHEYKMYERQAALVAHKSAVALYWAGSALDVARTKCKEGKHGLWAKWKKKYKIANTTANDAIRLYKNAGSPESLKGMGVTEAKKKFVYPGSPVKFDVEQAAINHVILQYEDDGWEVRSVEKDRCGYDLECRRDGKRKDVEVKGLTNGVISFTMTKREWSEVESNPDFVVCVVTKALHDPHMHFFDRESLDKKFVRTPTQYHLELR
jgi:hypothetical protein